MGTGSIGVWGLMVATVVLLLAASSPVVAAQQAGQGQAQAAPAQTVGDTWPEFEVPPIPEDKDGTQIRLSRIRDGYLAVNTHTDPSITAELLIGDALANKGFSPEQVFAVQQVVGLLVKTGVVEVNAQKLAAVSQAMPDATAAATTSSSSTSSTSGRRRHLRSATVSNDGTIAAQERREQEHEQEQERRRAQGCCPCEMTMGHHPKPSGPPHHTYPMEVDRQQQQQQQQTKAVSSTAVPQTRQEKASMYKTMKAVGLALRRAAAARAFYLYMTEDLDVHSFDEFESLSAEEQEATRAEVVGQLLVTCHQYGLSGEELQKYASVAGVEIPDLSHTSKAELKDLGSKLASHHSMEKVAWAMGEDMGWYAAKAIREQVGDAMLRRIGIEPSPELDAAFSQFYEEAQRFGNLSRRAAESQGLIEQQEAEASFFNVTRTADRIAKTMEGVNVTDVLITATQLMVEAEPYLNEAIEHPIDPEERGRGTEPWRVILKLSKLEKEMDEQRRSFSIVLRPDNALDGLLALNASGQAADDPLMRELNMTAIADMTADGAMDIDELAYLVKRVGALNEVYDVDQFERLMKQVEENYRAMQDLRPAADGAGLITAAASTQRRRRH